MNYEEGDLVELLGNVPRLGIIVYKDNMRYEIGIIGPTKMQYIIIPIQDSNVYIGKLLERAGDKYLSNMIGRNELDRSN
jgi:hypothetical protein